MSNFVNDSSLALERWSGFKPCSDTFDCALSEATQYDFLVTCQFLTEGPVRGQKYCICGLSLAGELCSIVTEAAVKQIVCFALYSLISLWPLLLGLWEIKERRKVNQKVNPVYVSLWIATAFGLFGLSFGLIGVYMIVAGPGTTGIMYVRAFWLIVLFPLCIATSLSSAMIISLELLKIVNDPVFGGNSSHTKQQRARLFVLAICLSLVLGYAITFILITPDAARVFLFSCIIAGAIFSLRSGRQFHRIANGFVYGAERTSPAGNMAQSFAAAIAVNRQASLGLSGLVVSFFLMTVAKNAVGSPTDENSFDIAAGVFVMMVLFLCVTAHASINFARKVRLIRNPTTKTTAITRRRGHRNLFASSVSKVAAVG
jgi:hypothetical protein